MRKTFAFYQDPGHGWIKVPVKLLVTLGVADKVSHYSYYRNGFAYLEEDNDAALFIHKMKSIGVVPKFRESHTDRQSIIRNYLSFDKTLYSCLNTVSIQNWKK